MKFTVIVTLDYKEIEILNTLCIDRAINEYKLYLKACEEMKERGIIKKYAVTLITV